MNDWRLTDSEWERLHELLAQPETSQPRRGRPRVTKDRAAAEACLYRHFHAHGTDSRTFGWHRLPKKLGVLPNTANRRFREWTETGAWTRFWDALVQLRCPSVPAPQRTHQEPERGSPVHALIAEFERAYAFFNIRFFGGTLHADVAIVVDRPPLQGKRRNERLGYFCGNQWRKGDQLLPHLAIYTSSLGQGAAVALEVLLHEMVHLRNHQVGLNDCDERTQYHNRHFRDIAILAGLTVSERDPRSGYAFTALAERGRLAVEELKPDEVLFEWVVDSQKKSGP